MEQYLNLLKEILGKGNVIFEPRTKMRTIGISGHSYNIDLTEGFPLLTTKEVPPRLPFEELFWKLRGERNIKSLVDGKINIWTGNGFDKYLKNNGLNEKYPKHSSEWNEQFKLYSERISSDSDFAESAGDLGPVYGNQWRHWVDRNGNEIDQLENLLNGIKKNPGSRYHILNAWNPGDLKDMALGPCPFFHQFTVYEDEGVIDLTAVQRSCDSILGVPFNDAQDALLLKMIANETGYEPRIFVHHFNNTHIYLGVSPRSDFWEDNSKVNEFQSKFNNIKEKKGYLDLRDWYLKGVENENSEDGGKDHIPYALEQLSRNSKDLPTISVSDVPLLDAIEKNTKEIINVENYSPHPNKWLDGGRPRMAV